MVSDGCEWWTGRVPEARRDGAAGIWLARMIVAAAVALGLAAGSTPAVFGFQREATAPHWIWHRSATSSETRSFPAETRYFRKAFRVKEGSRLVLDVTADNAFSLYLDGKLVAEGNDWASARHFETKIEAGPHVLAVRASNEAVGPAGLLLRGGVLPLGQGVPIQTNSTWRSRITFPRVTAGRPSSSTTGTGPGPWTWGLLAAGPGAGWPSRARTHPAGSACPRASRSRP